MHTNTVGDDVESQKENKQEEEGMHINQLTRKDYWIALKEIALPYIIPNIIFWFAFIAYTSAVYLPALLSSSLTYHGGYINSDVLLSKEGFLNLIGMAPTIVLGISLMTPLGRIIPEKASPYIFWIPTITMVVLLGFTSFGLLTGAFPPISIGANIVITIFVYFSQGFISSYYPIFFRFDNKLSKEYHEFQFQISTVLQYTSELISSIICVIWFQQYLTDGCVTNYEEVYDGVNCVNFK